MRDSHPSANRFRRTRDDHLEETAADYCELIDDLIDEHGEARAVQLARRFGISQVTVSKTVQRLVKSGHVIAEPYRSITLTDKGLALAEASREKHRLVKSMLLRLGVSDEIAEFDAEGMEHHLSQETLDAIRSFLSGRDARK